MLQALAIASAQVHPVDSTDQTTLRQASSYPKGATGLQGYRLPLNGRTLCSGVAPCAASSQESPKIVGLTQRRQRLKSSRPAPQASPPELRERAGPRAFGEARGLPPLSCAFSSESCPASAGSRAWLRQPLPGPAAIQASGSPEPFCASARRVPFRSDRRSDFESSPREECRCAGRHILVKSSAQATW
jgi:hypothetical protein